MLDRALQTISLKSVFSHWGALPGYFVAITIDKMGRRNMQLNSFVCIIFLLVMGCFWDFTLNCVRHFFLGLYGLTASNFG
jgi:hypothetical protein